MATKSCDIAQALNEAFCREEEGEQFYDEVSGRTLDEKGAEAFQELAAEAKTQADILREQIRSLTDGDTWDLPDCVLACEFNAEEPLFPHDLKAQRAQLPPDATELEAYLFGMEKEEENYDYYAGHIRTADTPEAKKLYEYLAEQARKRFDLLRLNYDAASHASGWA